MNPYEVLGIPPSATRDEIHAAWRRKAAQHHPDRNPGDPAAKERFQALQEARNAALARISGKPAKPAPAPLRRRDLRREVHVGVAEAVRGCKVRIEGSSGPCPGCGGDGHLRSRHPIACQTCGGTGISGYRERGIIRVKVGCPDCGGSGRSMRIRCVECGGVGTTPSRPVELDVPEGCADGSVFLVEGGASDPAAGLIGDLEIVVRVKADAGFRPVGDDIEADVPVEVWEAALGVDKALTLPDGKPVRLAVPPGSQHGRPFRLKGHGLAKEEGGKGDFVAILSVRVPNASSGEAREAFERLRDALATSSRRPG